MRGGRNFGVMAHIDAGKTTITERLLFYTGKLHVLGEVHDGTTVMDWMEQERERGITIASASTFMCWQTQYFNSSRLNVIDTPGHIDFTAEVERSLRVLDGAVVVLDASAGIESQTEAIWRQADRYNLPRLVFCNKMDKLDSNYWYCVDSLRSKLDALPLPLQIPIDSHLGFKGIVDVINMTAMTWSDNSDGTNWTSLKIPEPLVDKAKIQRDELIACVGGDDFKSLQVYLSAGVLKPEALTALIRLACIKGKAFPVLCGSAFKNKAIQPLLDAIVNYLPSPDDVLPAEAVKDWLQASVRFASCLEPLAVLVFKTVADVHTSRLSYIRLYSGVLTKGDFVYNPRCKKRERISKILRMHANFKTELTSAAAGDIAAVAGLQQAVTGDTLCDVRLPIALYTVEFPAPVIQVALEPQSNSDQEKLILALEKLQLEDPTLKASTNPESEQIVLAGMGELHLEVAIDRLRREHLISVKSGKPQIAYRETIAALRSEEYIHKKQTGGVGQFAKVKIVFEPSECDGFEFVSKIVGGVIPKEFIPGVKRGLEAAFISGPTSGYPVIKIKATLVDGEYHEVDSSLIAFETAARQCFRQAVQAVGSRLLEPVMKVEVAVPNECVGSIVCDLGIRRAHITSQAVSAISAGSAVIEANVPLANMFKYVDVLRSLSRGRGTYTMHFGFYGELRAVSG
ncbi:MAG: elongation factor G [Candidatus Hodgkinia cicadicola]